MKRFVPLIFALLLMAGCSREAGESPVGITLGVDMSSTRVMLDSGFHTLWNSGDRVSVFYKSSTYNSGATFQGGNGDSEGTVFFYGDGSDPASGLTTYAVSPYSRKASLALDPDAGDVLAAEIPAVQGYRSGSYGRGAAVLVAASKTDNLQFRYASSIVCLELFNKSLVPFRIEQVALSALGGESVCGEIAVNMKDPSSPDVSLVRGGKEIVMKNEDGQPLCMIAAGARERFFFSAAPVQLSKGYSFAVKLAGVTEPVIVRETGVSKLLPGTLGFVSGSFLIERSIGFDFVKSHWTGCPSGWFTGPVTNNENGLTLEFCGVTDSSVADYDKSKFTFLTSNGAACIRFNNKAAVPSWIRIPCPEGAVITGLMLTANNYSGEELSAVPFSVYSKISDPGKGVVSPSDCLVSGSIAGEGLLYFSSPFDGPVFLYTTKLNAQISSLRIICSDKE